MTERTTGIYRLTQWSNFYEKFQHAIGSQRGTKTIVEDYIAPLAPRRVLDLGCGPANILRYIDCDT